MQFALFELCISRKCRVRGLQLSCKLWFRWLGLSFNLWVRGLELSFKFWGFPINSVSEGLSFPVNCGSEGLYQTNKLSQILIVLVHKNGQICHFPTLGHVIPIRIKPVSFLLLSAASEGNIYELKLTQYHLIKRSTYFS